MILGSLGAIWSDRPQRCSREGRYSFSGFGHWRWLDLFASSRLDEAGEAYLPAFVAIGRNETVRDVFIRALHPKDNPTRALELFVHFKVNPPALVSTPPQLAAAPATAPPPPPYPETVCAPGRRAGAQPRPRRAALPAPGARDELPPPPPGPRHRPAPPARRRGRGAPACRRLYPLTPAPRALR